MQLAEIFDPSCANVKDNPQNAAPALAPLLPVLFEMGRVLRNVDPCSATYEVTREDYLLERSKQISDIIC